MSWAAFLTAVSIHLAAAASPGPCFVVALRVAAAEGFRTAVALAIGFGLGALLWAAAALAGLAVLFELMPSLLLAIRILGAAFLFYVAFMLWRHAKSPLPTPDATATPRSALSAVRFGFATFASNPKTAIFFGAIFVGLVPPGTSWPWLAGLLGVIFLNETLWYIAVARLFSLPRPRAAYARIKTGMDRALGALLAAFGLKIALF